jgi:1,6-anhydro-N-acetylmuramate kinase
MKDKLKHAEELANAHWAYVKQVLENAGVEQQVIEQIGFHYRTAFVHGYKHAIEDMTVKTEDLLLREVW